MLLYYPYYISVVPDMEENGLTEISLTNTSVEIEFEQLSLNDSMEEYYFYVVEYKEPGGTFTDVTSILHNNDENTVSFTIDELELGQIMLYV